MHKIGCGSWYSNLKRHLLLIAHLWINGSNTWIGNKLFLNSTCDLWRRVWNSMKIFYFIHNWIGENVNAVIFALIVCWKNFGSQILELLIHFEISTLFFECLDLQLQNQQPKNQVKAMASGHRIPILVNGNGNHQPPQPPKPPLSKPAMWLNHWVAITKWFVVSFFYSQLIPVHI